ncbi:pyruvate, water dikinase regulatory protein [Vagococcus elongatus]|uniref:Putative pyruvate, phosphate dikinase regulatory protein n=1 Tax=Vagococcus elongatus TaxID=180344 RepID=A0A430ANX3_9ENTE|nr:pyruvate, water dikinase regulatory protein [Vagococcus elongatus]RSU09822.1 phosphoenolpyruvate synthase regulatory protein [Vagococcus elongatus]
MKKITLFIISDSVGETAQKMISAVMAQFPSVTDSEFKRYPFVTDEAELKVILRDALQEKAIVVATLVNSQLVKVLQDFSARTGLEYVDYMSSLTEIVQRKSGVTAMEQPGALHKLDKEYFDRVAAIEFAIKYDDGKDPRGFLQSDFVILGVSRTSKTPLSMYLANKSYKISNLPLIPEMPLPQELLDVPSEKLIGLTAEPEKLVEIRKARLNFLGLNADSQYACLERISEEVLYAEDVYKKLNATVIHVDNRSIEETAAFIEELSKK